MSGGGKIEDRPACAWSGTGALAVGIGMDDMAGGAARAAAPALGCCVGDGMKAAAGLASSARRASVVVRRSMVLIEGARLLASIESERCWVGCWLLLPLARSPWLG
jgi:hypothetical protein